MGSLENRLFWIKGFRPAILTNLHWNEEKLKCGYDAAKIISSTIKLMQQCRKNHLEMKAPTLRIKS